MTNETDRLLDLRTQAQRIIDACESHDLDFPTKELETALGNLQASMTILVCKGELDQMSIIGQSKARLSQLTEGT